MSSDGQRSIGRFQSEAFSRQHENPVRIPVFLARTFSRQRYCVRAGKARPPGDRAYREIGLFQVS